tara:strand:+ start:2865 stop:4463 length:1599 start_codon:yes stop_codon:yes gene_type:complete
MKLKHVFISILFVAPLLVGAQHFQIQNQFGFGTPEWDYLYSVVETTDGGFLFCARTGSGISGDKTSANFGELDIWLVKTNSTGTILWQKSYGGSSNDAGYQLLQTMDGNFLLSCVSTSTISGNKSVPGYGSADLWLIKIDELGNILWQKSYGGNAWEFVPKIAERPNGDIYSTGSTSSLAATGTRQAPLKGTASYWVLQLDSAGNLKKEFCFGGNLEDFGKGSHRLSANSQIFIGASSSSDTLDKSEPSYGENDIWVLKTDTNGNISTDKTIGGNRNDVARGSIMDNQGNIIIISESESPVSGNKTAAKIAGKDLWLVKLDTNLNIIWDKTFGGLLDESVEFGGGMYSTSQNISIICGASESPKIGNKTSENFGGFDFWIIGVDNQGNKVMEISLGGLQEDIAMDIIETSTGALMVVGASESGVSGNKTIANQGVYDAWVVKLDIMVSVNEIKSTTIDAYPIPASTILNFSVPVLANHVLAQIVDITGKTVLSKNLNSQPSAQFDVTTLKSGTYFLTLTGANFSYSRMVVIE